MPKIDKSNDNMYKRTNTGADFNRALGVLKDTLVIIDGSMVSSRIIPTGFKYIMGVHELEVYLNGLLLRTNETINGSFYGDYTENSNFSILINDPPPSGFIVGSQLRFRITTANYKISSISGGGGIDPSIITQLQNEVAVLNGQMTGVNNLIQQVGHDSFGGSYAFPGTPSGSTRTIGTISDGDTDPNLSAYRAWTTSNTGNTSIASFTGGVREDQRLIIVSDDHTIFVHNPASLVLVDGLNILAKSGEIYLFMYDGTVWRQFGSSSAGFSKWKETVGTFTAVPFSTSALTLDPTADLPSKITSGMALKYKIAGTYYYGICHAIAPNLLTVNGAPLTGNVTELFYDETLSKVIEMVIPANGYYEYQDDSALISDFCGYYILWTKQTSYCVKYSVISKTCDTGALKGKCTVLVNGLDINSVAGGLSIATNATLYSTIVNINVSNYDINYGEYIELKVAKGTNGDAADLTAILTFVCP